MNKENAYVVDRIGLWRQLTNKDIPANARLLLEIITENYQFCMNKGYECRISTEKLVEWTGFDKKTVRKHIKTLDELELITVETEKIAYNKNSVYRFTSSFVHRENISRYRENISRYRENISRYREKIPPYTNINTNGNTKSENWNDWCDFQPPFLQEEDIFK